MEQKKMRIALFVGLFVALVSGFAMAAGEKEPAEDDWFSEFRNPAPWLEMGLDFRFRTIMSNNITTLNTLNDNYQWNFQRYRTRWRTKWMLNEDVDFNTRLTWEFRTWQEPPSKPQETDFDEAVFDNFNFKLRNLFDMPLTATIGRQDLLMVFGVGWLVMDATPLDGSRTFYFDAARFTYDWADNDTTIDLLYIDNAAASDRWLKPIEDRDRIVTEQDERGAILYLTNQADEKTKLEAYFMYKNDNPVDLMPGDRYNGFSPRWSKKAEIYTFGGAVSKSPDENWKYRIEGAFQTGEKSDATADLSTGTMQDMEAFGVLTNLEYLFNDSYNSSAHIGYEYCSGDDPDTDDNEQFDLLWGEWPRWSELYIYTYAPETMIAETTNLHRVNLGHKFNLNKQWQICTDYHLLWADENPAASGLAISDSSKFRGQLITCWAKYRFSKRLWGHILGEYFMPDNYYDKSNRDDAFFCRFNLEYNF